MQKVNREYIYYSFSNVIVCHNRAIDNMIDDKNPHYYNAGVYEWNWCGYIVDNNTVIITGYRNFPRGYYADKKKKIFIITKHLKY